MPIQSAWELSALSPERSVTSSALVATAVEVAHEFFQQTATPAKKATVAEDGTIWTEPKP